MDRVSVSPGLDLGGLEDASGINDLHAGHGTAGSVLDRDRDDAKLVGDQFQDRERQPTSATKIKRRFRRFRKVSAEGPGGVEG